MLEAERRHAAQMDETHIRRTHHDRLVAATQFGPGLLDERYPEGSARRVPVSGLSKPARNIIIDGNILPNAADAHLDNVAPGLVCLNCLEQLADALRLLREGREARKQVAVTQAALLDVFGR